MAPSVILHRPDGRVVMSAPLPVLSSVSDPVFAVGVPLLAPDRLATHKWSPDTAKAERRLKKYGPLVLHMYQLGVPVVADSLVTIGLVPKGLAMKTSPCDWMATEGRPKPYCPSESVKVSRTAPVASSMSVAALLPA